MANITKEDIRKAFLTKQRKRNLLLYNFYRNEYFIHGYTARFIADKITTDLGITISEKMVYLIFYRIMKKGVKQVQPAPPVIHHQTNQVNPEGEKILKGDSQAFVFRNADDYPQKNPFEDVLKDL